MFLNVILSVEVSMMLFSMMLFSMTLFSMTMFSLMPFGRRECCSTVGTNVRVTSFCSRTLRNITLNGLHSSVNFVYENTSSCRKQLFFNARSRIKFLLKWSQNFSYRFFNFRKKAKELLTRGTKKFTKRAFMWEWG